MPVLVWPDGDGTIPRVSSEYGPRWHPIDKVWRLHGGIDLVGFSTVCSPVDGTVKLAAYSGGFGNLVKIRAWGANAFKPGDEHWLAHNARFLVAQGATVKAGQGVAIMGTTGASTGIHCHYETRPGGGSPVDPRHYFVTAASGGASPFPEGEEDMPLSNADLQAILLAQFNVPGVGTVRVLDALGAVYSGTAGAVWAHPLEHTLAKDAAGNPAMASAGDLLRFEPAEHENTRRAVALVATGDFDYDEIAAEIAERFPSIDVGALAVAAADEADRRERMRLDVTLDDAAPTALTL